MGLSAYTPLNATCRPPRFYRRFIEGLRGLSVVGDPVYGGYFQRLLHARPVELHAAAPPLEGWDFGQGHPCVVWAQFLPQGALQLLGGVMGVSRFIEDFCPVALQYRATTALVGLLGADWVKLQPFRPRVRFIEF